MIARYEVVEVRVNPITSEQTYYFCASRETYEEAMNWIADYMENGPGERMFNIEKTYGNALKHFK